MTDEIQDAFLRDRETLLHEKVDLNIDSNIANATRGYKVKFISKEERKSNSPCDFCEIDLCIGAELCEELIGCDSCYIKKDNGQ